MTAAELPAPNPPSFSFAELEQAIKRSQNWLLGQQKPDGYWIGELMVDCTLVADVVAYRHWDGTVDAAWQRKAVNHIFSLQMPAGGWSIYQGGPAEVNATVKAYLALKLAGVPVTDPRMLRARQTALSLGGVPRLNTFSKLYLALMGLYPWKYVPTIPCEVILIGKWFDVQFLRHEFLEPLHARAPCPSSTISNPRAPCPTRLRSTSFSPWAITSAI